MKITALVENTTKTNCPVEHGLSLFIETDNHRILFDTGQSDLFITNAAVFGIDLKSVDICVLSHGHYDHGGGLKAFTGINDTAVIYMNKNAFGLHYHRKHRYIGLNRDWLEDGDFQKRILYTEGDVRIDEGLQILTPGEDKIIDIGSSGLYVKEDGAFLPEDFRHEHYLMIEEGGKRVLISGCSHQGIINIMSWFQPDVLVGGFHFMEMEPGEELLGYAGMLDRYDTVYYTCHCTGAEQYRFLRPHMRKLHYLSEGQVISV